MIKKMLTLFSNKFQFIKNYKIALFIIIILLAFFKSPFIFLNGRFVAEEGSHWFYYSYLNGPVLGLFQIYTENGYFNLWPNIASAFATFVPLEISPYVTVYFAFLVKVYLFSFIIFQNSIFLKTNFEKFIAALIVLVAPPMVAEVWLNTLTSQVYFTLIVLMIFFQTNTNNFYSKSSSVVLFISTLSSITSCIFAPFFLIKYIKEKNKLNFLNLFSVFVGSFIQTCIFIIIRINNLESIGETYRYNISLEKILSFLYNGVYKSFLGRDLTQSIYFSIENFLHFNLIIISSFVIFFLFIIVFFKKIIDNKVLIYLIIFFIIQSFLAIYASKGVQVQGRYALIPGILLIFIVLKLREVDNFIIKWISSILITLSIITGLYEYKHKNKYPHFLTCINCPVWKEEVKKWRKDNSYELKIWDYPRKKMKLIKDN